LKATAWNREAEIDMGFVFILSRLNANQDSLELDPSGTKLAEIDSRIAPISRKPKYQRPRPQSVKRHGFPCPENDLFD
jgi:hypothetical protein